MGEIKNFWIAYYIFVALQFMSSKEIKKRILLRLSKGITTPDELKSLVKIYADNYKSSGKEISAFIEYQSFKELLRRLQTSVFSETGKEYPLGFKKYCIYAEYHNTKLFIETIKNLLPLAKQSSDITSPKFYSQPDNGYRISYETFIHILLRHNESINSFINKDSQLNGHNPSSFSGFVLPILTMFMALNALKDNDWQSASKGKNLICHFAIGEQLYTITRKGHSKEILSFYPRNDKLELQHIKLERNPEKMEFIKQ